MKYSTSPNKIQGLISGPTQTNCSTLSNTVRGSLSIVLHACESGIVLRKWMCSMEAGKWSKRTVLWRDFHSLMQYPRIWRTVHDRITLLTMPTTLLYIIIDQFDLYYPAKHVQHNGSEFRNRHEISINPFTPKSDQIQISPAASPVILHHTVWRTWLFIAYSVGKWFPLPNSHYLTYTFIFKRLGECTFWTWEWKG